MVAFNIYFLDATLLKIMIREDCREQVDGYPCARYKKLATVEEAEAWMQGGASPSATGPVGQRSAPYSMKPKIRPVEPTSTVRSGFKSHPVAGPSRITRLSPSLTTKDVVYTDGACSRNGHTEPVAGIGVWWGPSDPRHVLRLAYGASN